MKIVGLLLLLAGISGCVEYSCYSNFDRSLERATAFCSAGNNDKALCESLEIDEQVCGIAKDNKCRPLGKGLKTFIGIHYYDCRDIKDKETCSADKFCEWTFSDPLAGTYADFWEPRRSAGSNN